MSSELVLLIATVVVVPGALAIFVRDVRMGRDAAVSPDRRPVPSGTSRLRVLLEAALPLIGIALLVWMAWAAL